MTYFLPKMSIVSSTSVRIRTRVSCPTSDHRSSGLSTNTKSSSARRLSRSLNRADSVSSRLCVLRAAPPPSFPARALVPAPPRPVACSPRRPARDAASGGVRRRAPFASPFAAGADSSSTTSSAPPTPWRVRSSRHRHRHRRPRLRPRSSIRDSPRRRAHHGASSRARLRIRHTSPRSTRRRRRPNRCASARVA